MKVYDHADIQVLQGNCLDLMKDLRVDLTITDPPYGIGMDYDSAPEPDTLDNWVNLTRQWLPLALSISKGVLFTPGGLEQETWLHSNFPPKWRICWYKKAQAQRSPIGFRHFELVFVYGDTKSQCPDYFECSPDTTPSKHPCPKPLGYAEWLIKNFSQPGDLILDPFMGTGTTLRAAKNLGRRAIGIDQSSLYVDMAIEKLSQEVLL